MNENIKSKEVRLVSEDGQKVMTTSEALNTAYDQGLDLVQVSDSTPPVCKMMDGKRYEFDLKKREKESKKNQKTIETKEIRMSPSIGENDYQTKVRSAIAFLAKGNHVKVTIRFRGREVTHPKIGEGILNRFCSDVSHLVNSKSDATMQGRMLSVSLKP